MNASWTCRQLTFGTDKERFHNHCYYDIPVFDPSSRYLAGIETRFVKRHPKPEDTVTVGIVDTESATGWKPLATSRAWSWQQGPMAQWLPHGQRLAWNDRDEDQFTSRIYDLDTGNTQTLPRPLYAIDPHGRFGLSVNMARLDRLRPGYGYAGGSDQHADQSAPSEDGVWRVNLETGDSDLILPLAKAVEFLRSRLPFLKRLGHRLKSYVYWFNHVKIAPGGKRFTVKLRFREPGKGWNDQQGVSLTCNCDGGDLRLLVDATSHVIWLDDGRLYLWRNDGVHLYRDDAPQGTHLARIGGEELSQNVHIRHLPLSPEEFVYDTPYQEEIKVFHLDTKTEERNRIAVFKNHLPKRGPFRCDLHPCPSPDAQKIAVSSLQDGGRQIYLLQRS